jgi:DNA modification methylase
MVRVEILHVEPRLSDPDLTLYVGDALAVLRELDSEVVDCCVTSPPYFGLRDYGIEGQVGLEATPGEYVVKMVEIFQEVRRVLAPHGTVWLNLGDSYAAQGGGKEEGQYVEKRVAGTTWQPARSPQPGYKPKDLFGIPWRVAFALQDDGWWLRSDIIWHKPNAMPSSVRDRPTTSHEYVFLLSKQARYYFDREAVLEPAAWERWGNQTVPKYEGTASATGWIKPQSKEKLVNAAVTAGGKNIRSVWTIPTRPYPEAHFATFPEELPRRAILAGCPEYVCRVCGKPRERIVESEPVPEDEKNKPHSYDWHETTSDLGGQKMQDWRDAHPPQTIGWTDCGHDSYRAGRVLDPFAGAGTTALVARSLERHSLLIELSGEYCDQIAARLQQLSLLA